MGRFSRLKQRDEERIIAEASRLVRLPRSVGGGGGGGSSTPTPKASSTVSGTVKTDIDQADPLVYTADSVDDALADAAADVAANYSPIVHTHDAADVVSGTFGTSRYAANSVTEAKIGLSDNTTDNVSSSAHGFAPKSPADATKFLNGAATPAYAQVKDSDLATTDVTNNNVSTSKHGFAPKGDGDTTKFLNANGGYSSPAGGGGGGSGGTIAGVLPLDAVPASPHASDDEFTGGSLDAKWTNPSVTANGLTLAVANDWVAFEPSTAGTGTVSGRLFGIRQAAPSGSFKIMAKVIATPGQAAGTDSYDGVFVGVSGGKGHVWGIGRNTNASLASLAATTYGEGASDWSTFDGVWNQTANLLLGYTVGWYRLRWDASATTLYFDYSLNGVAWQLGYTRTGQSQPTSIGLGMYATNNTFRADKSMGADWFRVEANATF